MPEIIEQIRWFQERVFEGYEILTSEQSILFGVSALQNDDWGYYFANDYRDNRGGEICDITLSDSVIDAYSFVNEVNFRKVCVNIVTNRGILQFVCWRDCNALPIAVKIDCNQLKYELVV